MLDSDYAHAEVPKAQPEMPVRVFLNSQLIAALRQHARPIVIEDQVLARPFVRLLRARDLRLGTVGALLAERISQPVLWGRYRGALVHRAIRPAGQRATNHPEAEGPSASYAGHKRIGVFFEVSSVERPTSYGRSCTLAIR
jgi:hypothetical protein